MGQNEQVYLKLQKHLDNQAIGFPATRSGVEIKILKHIFTPEEVEIACCLSYKFEPLETISAEPAALSIHLTNSKSTLLVFSKKGELNPKSSTAKRIIAMPPLSWGCTNFN